MIAAGVPVERLVLPVCASLFKAKGYENRRGAFFRHMLRQLNAVDLATDRKG